ncbi:MAG: hypothetical protein CMF38_07450 [Legionellaceae bacterium]|nr:hypothetical protein [Legionellaceae bacterium]|tara:strand:+ start:3273 stop:4181 length:909 start_codon:yes stop_codon:yes gene_type:complete
MFNFIRVLFNRAVQPLLSTFNRFFSTSFDLTDTQKAYFISKIIHGQFPALQKGFALRHVDNQATFEANVKNGFCGDAVSYSITSDIMSLALEMQISTCSFYVDITTGQVMFLINDKVKYRVLDNVLAVQIFDILHEKILQFVSQNFYGNSHYFILIKDMPGATKPYDIKTFYPTGKCGKQKVMATQIVSSASKSHRLNSPEAVVRFFEKAILKLDQSAKHSYNPGSTKAILSILREIELRPDENVLTFEGVQSRLISAEYDRGWTDSQFENFHGNEGGGYLKIFKQNLLKINDDLEYFRLQL